MSAGTCARVTTPKPGLSAWAKAGATDANLQTQLTILQTAAFSFTTTTHVLFPPARVCASAVVRAKRINGQAARLISIGKLHTSLYFHTRPIDLVIFQEPSETYV